MARGSTELNAVAIGLIRQWLKDGEFSLTEANLLRAEADEWVRIIRDPQRFQPTLFSGEWAIRSLHPSPGDVRILRVMTGTDGITRAIARQGKYLFAYPWC